MEAYFRSSLDAARPLYPVNDPLDVDSGRDSHMRANHNRKRGGKVDAVAGLGRLGIHAGAQSQQDLGPGRHDDGPGRWGYADCICTNGHDRTRSSGARS